ncbi:MAG: NADH-quinone oxidoreductase subunit N [Anaerolineae bacterium]|jgi:NADH-quinone oxidoreductase subunit N|nr:NADH-quinone oxidoreductase subunit N [Anaerolineae bacterium]
MGEFNVWTSLPAVAPEVGLAALAAIVLLLDAYLPQFKNRTRNIAYVTAAGMAALALTPFIWAPPAGTSELYWGGMIRHDALGQIFAVMLLLAGAITSLIAVEDSGAGQKSEFHLVIIVATMGGTLLAKSADLVMIFIALETLSIPLYMLAAFRRMDGKSAESGLKYFLFGSFTTALLLYGFSLLFGFTGTTSLAGIADGLASGTLLTSAFPVLVALLLVIVGFSFKISAVPFHFWTPDVYEGAPTPVTAFLSVGSKAASFMVFMRLLIEVFGLNPNALTLDNAVIQQFWVGLLTVFAILTMTLGNLLALRQNSFKRLLAYSSIAQAGYTLMGLAALQAQTAAGQDLAMASVSFYMFMYTFTNLVIFGGIIVFAEYTGRDQISDFAGLQRRNPWLALMMTIGLLSLAGIPPAAGFFGKLFLFQAAVQANLVGLAIIGVLNAIIGLYYYLVIIKIMYVDHGQDEEKALPLPRSYAWALGISTVVVLILGVIPAPIFDWAMQGAAAVRLALGS